MHPAHMSVDTLAFGKGFHANPTYMCLATCASHMVTSFCPLDRRFAARTILHVMLLGPFLELLFGAANVIRTFKTIVIFDTTFRANTNEAFRALKNGVFRCGPIYLTAVRSGTVIKLAGARVNVCEERRVDDRIKIACGQNSTSGGDGEQLRAARFVSKTC